MHLFLEGSVRTGKSTLLRQCLAPYFAQYGGQIGGFSCQRLWQEGEPRGYRLTSADNLTLDAPFAPELSGIFLYHGKEGTKKELSVFESSAVSLLNEAKNSRLILLDEIGGVDLTVPVFHEKLYEILAGGVPCIGVLKSNENARHVGKKSASAELTAQNNQQLRRDLTEQFDAEILQFTREDAEEIRRKIETFLAACFKTL